MKSYYFILILLTGLPCLISCQNIHQNRKKELKQTQHNTLIDKKKEAKAEQKKLNNHLDISQIRCNTNIVKSTDENIKKLTNDDIKLFLLTFHNTCKNNAEYLEYSNEVLFAVMNNYPQKVLKIIKNHKEMDKDFILEVLSNPVNDQIDISGLKNKLRKLNDSLADKIIDRLPKY